MPATMTKKKAADEEPEDIPETPVGGRQALKYVALPTDLWQYLKDLADTEERSVSWVARKAVREWRKAREEGRIPK